MSVQAINHPSIEAHTKPINLSKVEWLGRQISIFGKRLYSQLTKITHLFYQTIKTHPKKTLVTLAGATATLLIYYKGKTLRTFLKSFNKDSKEKALQQKISTLSKQFSEESKKLEQQLPIIEKNIQNISETQRAINASMEKEQRQIRIQYTEIQENFKKLIESKSPASALPEEKITLLETNINSLPALKQRITQLITEIDNQKTHLSHYSNPFSS